jgi:outer membrane PBP1 activator LpoA protein
MASQFIETFQQSGQVIVDQATYNPARVDHSDLLERVLGLDQSNARIEAVADILGEPVEAQPQRRQDIEFIFLAAGADDARQIRPQLRFFRAEDLPIVSTSYAVDGAVDARRDVDLEGVWMPMAPWFLNEAATTEQRRQARALYPQLTTATLSHLYAMGKDLVMLMRWWDAMQADPDSNAPGLTGQLRVDASGQIQRELPWVSIEGGRAKPMVW